MFDLYQLVIEIVYGLKKAKGSFVHRHWFIQFLIGRWNLRYNAKNEQKLPKRKVNIRTWPQSKLFPWFLFLSIYNETENGNEQNFEIDDVSGKYHLSVGLCYGKVQFRSWEYFRRQTTYVQKWKTRAHLAFIALTSNNSA